MSNRFHNCVNLQLEERLSKHSVVVFYDPRREFAPFIDELQEVGRRPRESSRSRLAACRRASSVTRSRSSRSAPKVEPLVAVDRPEPLLIYIPGVERDRRCSVLMELELGGQTATSHSSSGLPGMSSASDTPTA